MHKNEREHILQEIEKYAEKLGGTFINQTIINTSGEPSRRIMIEYKDDN